MEEKIYPKITLGPKESFGVVPMREIDGKKEFLLVRSVNGHWSFPKGKQKKGETEKQSALREFQEETGIEKIELDEGTVFQENYRVPTERGPVSKIVRYFLGTVDPDAEVRIQKEEMQDFVWVPTKEVGNIITYEESKEMFEEIKKYLIAKA